MNKRRDKMFIKFSSGWSITNKKENFWISYFNDKDLETKSKLVNNQYNIGFIISVNKFRLDVLFEKEEKVKCHS
jgi:hypothetical protein